MAFGVFARQVPHRLRAARKSGARVDLFRTETRIPIDPHKECPLPDYPGVVVLKVNGNVKLRLANNKTVEVPIAEIGGIRTKINKVPVPVRVKKPAEVAA